MVLKKKRNENWEFNWNNEMKKDFGPEVRVSVSEQFSALHSFTSQMATFQCRRWGSELLILYGNASRWAWLCKHQANQVAL